MSKPGDIKDILGADLDDFKVVLMYEVYRADDDGKKSSSVGFLEDQEVATAFATIQRDPAWVKIEPHIVLTDSKVAFILDEKYFVQILNQAKIVEDLKKSALAKLSPGERKILGIE